MSVATLNDLRVTHGRVNVPPWGRWYAEIGVDGEHELAKASSVDLKLADLTLVGSVLNGGPSNGRSWFRIVAGAGKWGRTLKKKSYVTDAGVKLATVLGDAATEVGETIGDIDPKLRVGPGWTRPQGPGVTLLNTLAPQGWYIDDAGTTQLGARAPGTLPAGVTHGPVDRARGTVTLASERIAAIMPGLVVDGLTVADVQHEISAKGGLRSTVWGSLDGGGSRDLDPLRRLLEQLDPFRKFRGVTEYRVGSIEGKRLNLQPIQASLGMPDLRRVPIRPGVAGCSVKVLEGSRVLVGFVNSDPGRYYVASFEDIMSPGFQPATLDFLAGGQAGGEHVATLEAVCVLIFNVLACFFNLTGPGPLTVSPAVQAMIGPAILAALAAQGAPAPPLLAAQIVQAAAEAATFATGTTPITSSAPFSAAILALGMKTPNVSGLFPSLGAAAVRSG